MAKKTATPPEPTLKLQDRIKELRRVRAGDLIPDEMNWRVHSDEQRDALTKVMERVGVVDAIIARETDDGLKIIDGHLRADLDPHATLPVLVLDVSEQEANEILMTLDPIAMMADSDSRAVESLLAQIKSDEDEDLRGILEDIRVIAPPKFDPNAEWDGMPDYSSEKVTSFRQITMHFDDQAGVDEFVKRTGIKITQKSRYAFFPEQPADDKTAKLRYQQTQQLDAHATPAAETSGD